MGNVEGRVVEDGRNECVQTIELIAKTMSRKYPNVDFTPVVREAFGRDQTGQCDLLHAALLKSQICFDMLQKHEQVLRYKTDELLEQMHEVSPIVGNTEEFEKLILFSRDCQHVLETEIPMWREEMVQRIIRNSPKCIANNVQGYVAEAQKNIDYIKLFISYANRGIKGIEEFNQLQFTRRR